MLDSLTEKVPARSILVASTLTPLRNARGLADKAEILRRDRDLWLWHHSFAGVLKFDSSFVTSRAGYTSGHTFATSSCLYLSCKYPILFLKLPYYRPKNSFNTRSTTAASFRTLSNQINSTTFIMVRAVQDLAEYKSLVSLPVYKLVGFPG